LNDSTIVALATSPGPGAIGVIRMSGEDSVAICERVFRGKRLPSQAADRSVVLGEITAADGSPIDQVLVLVMRGPRSLTGEDVVEISCHGGRLAPRLVLRRLIEEGAEPAEAGEFTKRAFLNGKMDLAQAEAVADIVRAGSERALRAAVRQLQGGLSLRFESLEQEILGIVAAVEADIDFPEEEDVARMDPAGLAALLDGPVSKLEELLATHEQGRHLRQGLDVAIVGKPNVGKSSIFNRLVDEERVITSPEPGTTRDVVDGLLSVDGLEIRLHDTAGVKVGVGVIEEAAVGRSRRAMSSADLALVVVDASCPLSEEDREILSETASRPRLLIANKTDLPLQADAGELGEAIRLSALKGWGLADLLERLREFTHNGQHDLDCEVLISERHAACIRQALAGLQRAGEAARERLPLELAASDLRYALDSLGEITGRKVGEGILDGIFSRFCIGK
jgi:tRNA modification GTPase